MVLPTITMRLFRREPEDAALRDARDLPGRTPRREQRETTNDY